MPREDVKRAVLKVLDMYLGPKGYTVLANALTTAIEVGVRTAVLNTPPRRKKGRRKKSPRVENAIQVVNELSAAVAELTEGLILDPVVDRRLCDTTGCVFCIQASFPYADGRGVIHYRYRDNPPSNMMAVPSQPHVYP